ncbi:RNA polymerase sigma factor [Sphingobacterium sp. UDSM-2020]|uniref:RNA polymerase sigma factor n=1 Tax=Sphingobacterium sp. UDSM-2020 TaxID=2795738 RepID=UPI001935F9CD|nr:sigma-70 family RNA polymerase sigma factor [Sphingobacterium sp. UDSM-2020]QQD14027.1 sigma-70 family RNA polymerase sigma factor [Sphingobacterium sp. UDSM-2020]
MDNFLITDTSKQPIAIDMHKFAQLYETYANAVYANILRLVKRPECAEDLLQEVFTALWQNRLKLVDDKSIPGWLFVVSYNKSITFLKKKVKEAIESVDTYDQYLQLENEDVIDEDLYEQQIRMIHQAVEKLPKKKREVFKLCRFEGRSADEVAKIMGISSHSVKDYLKQSNRAIKDYIQNEAPYTALGLLVIFYTEHL